MPAAAGSGSAANARTTGCAALAFVTLSTFHALPSYSSVQYVPLAGVERNVSVGVL
jgi:hypothetical protein